MIRLRVTAKKLNRRKAIPISLPDEANIVGTVKEGFEFGGEEVETVPNPSLGTWFRDNDNCYYWGGGLSPIVSINSWWLDSLQIPSIWNDFEEYGENSKVAILDTGFNDRITDIKNAVKASSVFSKSYGVLDLIGDTYGHGSHCASLIAGQNKMHRISCAPKAQLYPAKICASGSVSEYSNISDAIAWAIQQGVHIISISYGGDSGDTQMHEEIKKAIKKNILVVASIGDVVQYSTNQPCFPAMYDEVIAVGASNEDRSVSHFTIPAEKTEVNAPGAGILGYTTKDKPEEMSGTSQAAAIVSGVCALLISHFIKQEKAYQVEDIRKLIADNVGGDKNKVISPLKLFNSLNKKQPR